MRKLSSETREILSKDKRMKKCCLNGECFGKIEWHHNLIYAGKQSDIPETILPLCQFHHRYADIKDIKEQLDWIMLQLLSDEQIIKLSKGNNYVQRKNYLITKFGKRHSRSSTPIS